MNINQDPFVLMIITFHVHIVRTMYALLSEWIVCVFFNNTHIKEKSSEPILKEHLNFLNNIK